MTETTQPSVTDQQSSAQIPKRLLSLDGGGIRGAIAARILLKIEAILKAKDPHFSCLGDYFDLIGGTSTGSLIAVALAKGMSAAEIYDIYKNRGREIFSPTPWGRIPLINQLAIKYKAEPLEHLLKEILQGRNGQQLTLGSKETGELKSHVMIVAKNATEGQTIFFVGHPSNRFYDQNKSLPLWQLARASSAAPTYFPPQSIELLYQTSGANTLNRKTVEFIDGGMSPYNNPSFQVFLEATKEDYGINWDKGADNLLLISIGTGFKSDKIPYGKAKSYNAIQWAPYGIGVLMEGSNLQQSLLMDLISQDRSVDIDIPFKPMLRYHRYNIELEQASLDRLLGSTNRIDVDRVSPLDAVDAIPELTEIGDAIANQYVKEEHFEGFFNP